VYPSGWRVRVPRSTTAGEADLSLDLQPVLADQELAFEQMPYWEGAVRINGTLGTEALLGKGYVELTGFKP
jgi:predicted secreted hydrolase